MNKKYEFFINGTDFNIFSSRKFKYCSEEFPIFDLEKRVLYKNLFKYPEHFFKCNFKLLNTFINNKNLYQIKNS